MVDRAKQRTDTPEARADGSKCGHDSSAGDEHCPSLPVALLEQLDRAAARLEELELRGLRLSLTVDPGGRPGCRLRRGVRSREIGLCPLLAFLSSGVGLVHGE
ncbi:MAG: hypothetical protein ACXVY8_03775 [Gaiellaceae bacterium]